MRVWATEWDVFHCTPSRGSRGRRAAVDIFHGVLFWCGGISFFFLSLSLLRTQIVSLLRTHTAYYKYEATLPHVPLYVLVMRPLFAFRQKSLFIPGCVQGLSLIHI